MIAHIALLTTVRATSLKRIYSHTELGIGKDCQTHVDRTNCFLFSLVY